MGLGRKILTVIRKKRPTCPVFAAWWDERARLTTPERELAVEAMMRSREDCQ